MNATLLRARQNLARLRTQALGYELRRLPVPTGLVDRRLLAEYEVERLEKEAARR